MKKNILIALIILSSCGLIIGCSAFLDKKRYYSPDEVEYLGAVVTEDNKNLYVVFNVRAETMHYPSKSETKYVDQSLEVKIERDQIGSDTTENNVLLVSKSSYLKNKDFNPYSYYISIPYQQFDTLCIVNNTDRKCYKRK